MAISRQFGSQGSGASEAERYGCDVMTRSRAYVAASVLCILHAALVSYAAWLPVGPNTGTFNRSFYFGIWPILVISWPLWLIVLFILWRRGERERWQLLVPAAVGIVALIPGLLYLVVMIAFFTHGPG